MLDNVQKHNQNYHLSTHIAFWKDSMINRLSNLINRNRSAAKISQVLCSSGWWIPFRLLCQIETYDANKPAPPAPPTACRAASAKKSSTK